MNSYLRCNLKIYWNLKLWNMEYGREKPRIVESWNIPLKSYEIQVSRQIKVI